MGNALFTHERLQAFRPQWAFALRPDVVLDRGRLTAGVAGPVPWKLVRLLITCRAVPAPWWEHVLFFLNRIWLVRWLFRSLIRIAHRRYRARQDQAERAAEVTSIVITRRDPPITGFGQRQELLLGPVPALIFSPTAIGSHFENAPSCAVGDSIRVDMAGSTGTFRLDVIVERPP